LTVKRLPERGARPSEARGHPSRTKPPAAASVSAVVLAAGCSTRMGRQKLLLPIDGKPMLRWVTDAAQASGAREIVVVTGCEATRTIEALEGETVRAVVNAAYADGLSTSVQAGISAVDPSCDAAVFLMGDQPFITAALIDTFITAFLEVGASVVRAMVGDRPAHPVLMSADLFPEILQQVGDVGARAVAARHATDTYLIQIDERTAMDVDAPMDYDTARNLA
jgi:molybdenum cofactor cytidylyltransferase